VQKAAVGGAKKSKPAVQSKFAAFRAKMKQKQTGTEESSSEEEKIFEAGFFTVSSPVRTPKFHCDGK
jgi:hypothetical protein